MNMSATLLGTGTPWPDLKRHGAGVIVKIGDEQLLFDAGRGVVYQALRAGAHLRTLNHVFITHHHFDHIGDLYDVILSTWIAGRNRPIQILGPPGTVSIVRALIEQVYAKDIAFRVNEYAPINHTTIDGSDIAKLEVKDIEPGLVWETDTWQIRAEIVKHDYDAGPPKFEWVCLGYRITSGEKSVVISGDTIPCEGLDRLAKGADLLIQCCLNADNDNKSPIMRHVTTYVLPSSGQVGRIAARAGVKKMVLTHIAPDASLHDMERDIRKSYDGELVFGEDLLEIDV